MYKRRSAQMYLNLARRCGDEFGVSYTLGTGKELSCDS